MIGKIVAHALPRGLRGDTWFSVLMFLKNHGRMPNANDPASFSDHLFKIKSSGELYDPLRQLTSDKILVKDYVQHLLGCGFTPRTISVLSNDNEIDDFNHSGPCVIKAAHAGQLSMIITEDVKNIDKAEMKRWLHVNYYDIGREANYRFLRKRIIVEELLRDDGGHVPKDFKMFCFYGEPQIIQVDADRFSRHTRNSFSNWMGLLAL
jgi:TupA-like ATPgrasp